MAHSVSWARYGDSDVRARIAGGGSGTDQRHYSGNQSFIRKLLSRCRAYEQEPSLAFYLHGCFYAGSLLSKFTVADNLGVTADITADSMVVSESYWRHEQDLTADLVRLSPLSMACLLYTSPSPRDGLLSRMPSSA